MDKELKLTIEKEIYLLEDLIRNDIERIMLEASAREVSMMTVMGEYNGEIRAYRSVLRKMKDNG